MRVSVSSVTKLLGCSPNINVFNKFFIQSKFGVFKFYAKRRDDSMDSDNGAGMKAE